MKSSSPARTGAATSSNPSAAVAYRISSSSVKRPPCRGSQLPRAPSGSVRWGPPSRPPQKVPTGRQAPENDRTGLSGAGRQSERRSTDHRSGCGVEQPGPAVRRCRANGDASAIHDQRERHSPPRTQFVRRRAFTGLQLRMGGRGEWLTIRAIDKRTLNSPPDHTPLH